jgi:hypothetical protein
MNAKFLLRKYLNTGEPIPEYQFNKLNPNLRTTYIRKRSIAIVSGDIVRTFEIPYISQDTWIESLEKNPWNIKYIKNPTDEVQDYILKNYKEYIFQINNPNDKIKSLLDLEEYQMYAVKKDPYYVLKIENLNDEVQDYILKIHPEYIFYIKNPNDKIKPLLDLEEYQMYVVEVHPGYIHYIKNPTDEVQDYILDNYPEYVKYIINPNNKIKQYKLDNNINESRMIILINESQLKTIIKDII